MTHQDDRPKTVSDMMLHVAAWLDLGDRAFETLARLEPDMPTAKAIKLPLGTGLQDDLRTLATWMRSHPEVDAEIYAALFTRSSA